MSAAEECSPQEAVERALAASRSEDCVVIAEETSSSNLRWAGNTLTTNGVSRSRQLTVIAIDRRGEGASAGVVSRAGVRPDQVEDVVERELLTPAGLRTLARDDPEYQARYEGGPAQRDGAYHQGTVWPWLIGGFIDAYLFAFGKCEDTLTYCRRLVESVEANAAGSLGSITEILDGDEPRNVRGCPAQAWSVAEIARVRAQYGL